MDVVSDLKNSAKSLFEFIDLFTKADVATFKKSAAKMKKLMDEHKINMDQAVLKKQYVDVCTLANKNNSAEMKMSFKDKEGLRKNTSNPLVLLVIVSAFFILLMIAVTVMEAVEMSGMGL